MWQELLKALCLVMVIEGILPFAAPAAWREAMRNIIALDNRSIRLMGLVSMLIGVGLLYLVH